jgi:hypothetical protein
MAPILGLLPCMDLSSIHMHFELEISKCGLALKDKFIQDWGTLVCGFNRYHPYVVDLVDHRTSVIDSSSKSTLENHISFKFLYLGFKKLRVE